MIRKIAAAAAVLCLCVGVASAAEIKGKLTKIEGDKITVVVGKKKDVAVRDVDISSAIPPTPAPAVGGMSESDVEKAYIRFADKVCACKDMNCFQKVAIEMSQKMSGQQPRSMSPKLMKAMEKMAKCMQAMQAKP